jgi:hypothetical protein
MIDFSGAILALERLVLGCFAIMTLLVGILFFQPDYKQEAIDRGFAVYCQDDGSWAWVGECNSGE